MKKFLKILLRIFIILIVLACLFVAVGAGYFYYTRWAKDREETVIYSGDKMIIKSNKLELEPCITCLFMGVNGALTDFIMLGKYNPNTREVNLMSIPRDTYIEKGGVDHKINSAYAKGMKPENTVAVVEELTGVKIDYYVLFKTKVLRELVDAVGGVEVTVPFNMNYEDPYQDLYIHLKKGTQILNGKQAEQFVRYRSGYANGDVGRIKTQQTFIKAMILRCLEPQNLIKVGTLVNIGLENTNTNITQEIASQYIDDAVAFKPDRVRIETLPGEGKYINQISYFVADEEAAEILIDELFVQEATLEEVKQMMLEEMMASGEDISGEGEKLELRTTFSGDNIKIEVLNNGSSPRHFNAVVDALKEAGYNVTRVGNVNESSTLSRIKSHIASEEALVELNKLAEVVGIKKLENDYYSKTEVDFTIVLGPKYVYATKEEKN